MIIPPAPNARTEAMEADIVKRQTELDEARGQLTRTQQRGGIDRKLEGESTGGYYRDLGSAQQDHVDELERQLRARRRELSSLIPFAPGHEYKAISPEDSEAHIREAVSQLGAAPGAGPPYEGPGILAENLKAGHTTTFLNTPHERNLGDPGPLQGDIPERGEGWRAGGGRQVPLSHEDLIGEAAGFGERREQIYQRELAQLTTSWMDMDRSLKRKAHWMNKWDEIEFIFSYLGTNEHTARSRSLLYGPSASLDNYPEPFVFTRQFYRDVSEWTLSPEEMDSARETILNDARDYMIDYWDEGIWNEYLEWEKKFTTPVESLSDFKGRLGNIYRYTAPKYRSMYTLPWMEPADPELMAYLKRTGNSRGNVDQFFQQRQEKKDASDQRENTIMKLGKWRTDKFIEYFAENSEAMDELRLRNPEIADDFDRLKGRIRNINSLARQAQQSQLEHDTFMREAMNKTAAEKRMWGLAQVARDVWGFEQATEDNIMDIVMSAHDGEFGHRMNMRIMQAYISSGKGMGSAGSNDTAANNIMNMHQALQTGGTIPSHNSNLRYLVLAGDGTVNSKLREASRMPGGLAANFDPHALQTYISYAEQMNREIVEVMNSRYGKFLGQDMGLYIGAVIDIEGIRRGELGVDVHALANRSPIAFHAYSLFILDELERNATPDGVIDPVGREVGREIARLLSSAVAKTGEDAFIDASWLSNHPLELAKHLQVYALVGDMMQRVSTSQGSTQWGIGILDKMFEGYLNKPQRDMLKTVALSVNDGMAREGLAGANAIEILHGIMDVYAREGSIPDDHTVEITNADGQKSTKEARHLLGMVFKEESVHLNKLMDALYWSFAPQNMGEVGAEVNNRIKTNLATVAGMTSQIMEWHTEGNETTSGYLIGLAGQYDPGIGWGKDRSEIESITISKAAGDAFTALGVHLPQTDDEWVEALSFLQATVPHWAGNPTHEGYTGAKYSGILGMNITERWDDTNDDAAARTRVVLIWDALLKSPATRDIIRGVITANVINLPIGAVTPITTIINEVGNLITTQKGKLYMRDINKPEDGFVFLSINHGDGDTLATADIDEGRYTSATLDRLHEIPTYGTSTELASIATTIGTRGYHINWLPVGNRTKDNFWTNIPGDQKERINRMVRRHMWSSLGPNLPAEYHPGAEGGDSVAWDRLTNLLWQQEVDAWAESKTRESDGYDLFEPRTLLDFSVSALQILMREIDLPKFESHLSNRGFFQHFGEDRMFQLRSSNELGRLNTRVMATFKVSNALNPISQRGGSPMLNIMVYEEGKNVPVRLDGLGWDFRDNEIDLFLEQEGHLRNFREANPYLRRGRFGRFAERWNYDGPTREVIVDGERALDFYYRKRKDIAWETLGYEVPKAGGPLLDESRRALPRRTQALQMSQRANIIGGGIY
jgi:hypothetical protein